LVIKTLNGMSSCLTRYGSFKSKTKIENVEQACVFGKETITDIESCYVKVQKQYVIPYALVESFFKTKGSGARILEMKELHNSNCPTVPQTLFK